MRSRRSVVVGTCVAIVAVASVTSCGGPTAAPPRGPEAVPTSLLLLSISPERGESVTRDTAVTATLRYSVESFKREAFAIVTQVATVDGTRATNASPAPSANPVLQLPSGTLTLRFPLASAWDNPDVARPIRIWFALTRIGLASGSRVVAKTDVVEWPAR